MGFWTSCRASCQQAVILDSSSSSGAKDLLDTTSRRPVHNLDDDGSCRRTVTSSHRTTTPDEIITTTTTTTTSSLPIQCPTNSDDRTSSSTVATELLVGPLLLSDDDAVADPNDEKDQVEQRTSSSLPAEDLLVTAQSSSDAEDDALLSIPLTKEQRMVCDSFHHGSICPSLKDSSGHSLLSGASSLSHPHPHHHHQIITIEEPATDQRIRFGKISIREYPNTVGDSPSTTRGVPITLCWTPRVEYELDLEDFEEVRAMLRRTVVELQMSSLDRLRRLKSEGWSGGELKQHYVQETSQQQFRRHGHRRQASWRYQWDWYKERLWRVVLGNVRRRRKQRERDRIQKWQEQDRKRTAIIHNTVSTSSILKNTTGIRS